VVYREGGGGWGVKPLKKGLQKGQTVNHGNRPRKLNALLWGGGGGGGYGGCMWRQGEGLIKGLFLGASQ
jgi:hypothetical protein